jgi:hypothetical protein
MFVPVIEARNPTSIVVPVAKLPLKLALLTVTSAPDCVATPFHNWVIAWPDGNDQVSVQLVSGGPLFVSCISPWKPTFHWFTTE